MNNNEHAQQSKNVSVGQTRNKLNFFCAFVFLITQILTVLMVSIVVSLLKDSPITMTVSVISIVLIEAAGACIIYYSLITSIDTLTRAVSASLREPYKVNPPNPNEIKGAASGELRKAVQAIYQYSTSKTEYGKNQPSDLAIELLQNLPIGIITTTTDQKITTYNERAPIDKSSDEPKIQLDFSTSAQSLADWLHEAEEKSINAQKIWGRIQNVSPDSLQERRIYDVIANYHRSPVAGSNVTIVTIDRTDEYIEAEESIDFVALAAHELRGPITVIRGYLDMLEDQLGEQLTQEQHDLFDRLDVSARRLASYINNVLNANRFDHHHLQLKLEETSPQQIQKDSEEGLNLRASTIGRKLIWQIDPELPSVAADRSSISEVLTNLVDNAIKYSKTGGSIEIKATDCGDSISFSVTDHGIGIPQSVADKIFTKFYRSHRSSTSIGGTGIGLYISRAIVESHGGAIGFDSTEGVGTTFTFTLPKFDTVKNKLTENNGSNENLINHNDNWIKNHGSIKQ